MFMLQLPCLINLFYSLFMNGNCQKHFKTKQQQHLRHNKNQKSSLILTDLTIIMITKTDANFMFFFLYDFLFAMLPGNSEISLANNDMLYLN